MMVSIERWIHVLTISLAQEKKNNNNNNNKQAIMTSSKIFTETDIERRGT